MHNLWNGISSIRQPHQGATRPVAKNFQVGVLSPRVLGPGESEARRIDSRETGFLGRGFTPPHQLVGHGNAVSSQQGLKSVWGAHQKSNFLHFSLKILHLVAPILLIFLRVITDHSVAPRSWKVLALRAKIWPLSRRPIVYTAHEAEKSD